MTSTPLVALAGVPRKLIWVREEASREPGAGDTVTVPSPTAADPSTVVGVHVGPTGAWAPRACARAERPSVGEAVAGPDNSAEPATNAEPSASTRRTTGREDLITSPRVRPSGSRSRSNGEEFSAPQRRSPAPQTYAFCVKSVSPSNSCALTHKAARAKIGGEPAQ